MKGTALDSETDARDKEIEKDTDRYISGQRKRYIYVYNVYIYRLTDIDRSGAQEARDKEIDKGIDGYISGRKDRDFID